MRRDGKRRSGVAKQANSFSRRQKSQAGSYSWKVEVRKWSGVGLLRRRLGNSEAPPDETIAPWSKRARHQRCCLHGHSLVCLLNYLFCSLIRLLRSASSCAQTFSGFRAYEKEACEWKLIWCCFHDNMRHHAKSQWSLEPCDKTDVLYSCNNRLGSLIIPQ